MVLLVFGLGYVILAYNKIYNFTIIMMTFTF